MVNIVEEREREGKNMCLKENEEEMLCPIQTAEVNPFPLFAYKKNLNFILKSCIALVHHTKDYISHVWVNVAEIQDVPVFMRRTFFVVSSYFCPEKFEILLPFFQAFKENVLRHFPSEC